MFRLREVVEMLTNLVTLAGRGRRFLDEGYSVPKPLIEVNGFMILLFLVIKLSL
jgi:NDP-sugar pyrophosphorylase family protein